MIKEIKNSLRDLGFHHNEIEVYVALTQLGEAKASQVGKKAGLPRTTVISILNKLAEENYLATHQYKGVTYYWVESPKVIADILEQKTNIAKQLNEFLGSLYRSEAHFPSANIFDTKNSIKNFIEKFITSLDKKTIIYTIDTPNEGNYTKIFSERTEEFLTDLKKKREIITRTLIPQGYFGKIAGHKIRDKNIIIREMPESVNFEASFWIAGDNLVHFSGNPPFAVLIKHESIVRGMKGIYDFLWSISEAKN